MRFNTEKLKQTVQKAKKRSGKREKDSIKRALKLQLQRSYLIFLQVSRDADQG